MPGPFDLSQEMAVDPLPVAPIQQPQPQPQQPNWRNLAPLAALIPAALARGGRVAVAGLLQGIQQGQQLKQQQSRLTAQDQRQASLDQQTEAYRQSQIQNQQSQQRLQYLKNFQDALGTVDSPDQVTALLDAYGTMGAPLGVERGALDKLALTTVTPSKLTQRRVEKAVKGMSADTLQAMMESQASLQDGERLIPFAEWSQYVAHGVDAQGKPVVRVQKPPTPKALQAKDVVVNGQRVLAHFDPDTGLYFAPGSDQPLQNPQPYVPPRDVPAPGSLPTAVQRRVDAQAKGFDSLPIVKTTQKMAEAVSFADSLNPNTTNPADDQALIYAFAKAMDPDSVVREGEYATVQKYAQSWAESFGFNAARIFSNTQFLTPQARANMKRTIRQKYLAGKQQYDNVRRSYAQRINKITGQQDGEEYLIDYGAAFPSDATPTGAGTGGSYEEYLRSRGQR